MSWGDFFQQYSHGLPIPQVNRLESPAPAVEMAFQGAHYKILNCIPLWLQISVGRPIENPGGERYYWHGKPPEAKPVFPPGEVRGLWLFESCLLPQNFGSGSADRGPG